VKVYQGLQGRSLNNRGDWVTATAYGVLDFFRDVAGNKLYSVLVAHTSTSVAADLAAGKLIEMLNITQIETLRDEAVSAAQTATDHAADSLGSANAAEVSNQASGASAEASEISRLASGVSAGESEAARVLSVAQADIATAQAVIATAQAVIATNKAAEAAASAASITPVAEQIHAATSKTTPVDADEFALADSEASFGLKKLTWAKLKENAGGGLWGGTAGGTVDAITFTTTPATTDHIVGQALKFISSGANTGAVTVAPNGLTPKAITKNGSQALTANNIPFAGVIVEITYDGTQYQITKIFQATSSLYAVGVAAANLPFVSQPETSVASATSITLATTLNQLLTGTTDVDTINSVAGRTNRIRVVTGGFALTHSAGLNCLQTGATITTEPGDTFDWFALTTSTGIVMNYMRGDGMALVGGGEGKNVIINGGFTINQRVYVSAASLASGSYGHDRWKAGAGGGDYSFTQLNSNTQITIAANKTLIQVVENKSVASTSYILSWEGTALARYAVNSATPAGSYAASPILITGQTAGTTMSIEFGNGASAGTLGKVKLEAGAVATPFEARSVGEELVLCQRYYYRINPVSVARQATGWCSSTSLFDAVHPFPVPMAAAPTALEQSGTAGDYGIISTPGTTSCTSVPTFFSADIFCATTRYTQGATLTLGHGGHVRSTSSAGYLGWSAEL
jgi:hypothetical protein